MGLRFSYVGGGSRKLAVALLGAHTPSKNPPPISGIQAYIALGRLGAGLGGSVGDRREHAPPQNSSSHTSIYAAKLHEVRPTDREGATNTMTSQLEPEAARRIEDAVRELANMVYPPCGSARKA
jgi:hypothetical protein